MSKIIDKTVDEVRIGSKIPIRDYRDPTGKTYYIPIEDKMEIHICDNCGHKVGKEYVENEPFCLDCLQNYEEKTLVRFAGDLQ